MTSKLNLAAQFVNSTARHIFLTGNAGTGKTTFLHNLATKTHKNYLVVAPTGIAALNANGVTIHSQFLLPFGSFLPQSKDINVESNARFYTKRQLSSRHALNSTRKKVLQSIDLLIIDEVSMLRADLLDAIDYRLKSVKGNFKESFGGVQLLLIGDLFQLPPIVKDQEWQFLKEFYNSAYFYDSLALKEAGFAYVELDKIFRQSDESFIKVLNNLRNNRCDAKDMALLNERYKEGKISEEGVVTLTTHNYKADAMNREALDKLPGPSHYYEAEVEGDFPEHLYPVAESMELREGAQVMFIKNDGEEKRFFNGKLAEVVRLTEDGVCVNMEDEEDFWVPRHQWENKKYKVNSSTKELDEEVVGSFTQYPLKLAWAITVHKSQGLTFEKAIIDVGQAFAPGQVYVALSRLRSLDGLILKTRISEAVVSNDTHVVDFSKSRAEAANLVEELEQQRQLYLFKLVNQTFEFGAILGHLEYVQRKMAGKLNFEDAEMQVALANLTQAIAAEEQNTLKFRHQLVRLLREKETNQMQKRLTKGRHYYENFIRGKLKELSIHIGEVKQLSRTKTYRSLLEELDQLLDNQLVQLSKVSEICSQMLAGEEIQISDDLELKHRDWRQHMLQQVEQYLEKNPKNLSTKSGRKKKKKGETYQKTFKMVKEGLTIKEIAAQRKLAEGTIESHISKGIAQGVLKLESFMEAEEIEKVIKGMSDTDESGMGALHRKFKGEVSYAKLRMVLAHLKNQKTSVE